MSNRSTGLILMQLTLPITGREELTLDRCAYTTETALAALTIKYAVKSSQLISASSLNSWHSNSPSTMKSVHTTHTTPLQSKEAQ